MMCIIVDRALQARRNPTEPDTLSPLGPGSGRFLFLQIGLSSGSAHLASLLLLCPNTRRLLTSYFLPPLFAWNTVLLG